MRFLCASHGVPHGRPPTHLGHPIHLRQPTNHKPARRSGGSGIAPTFSGFGPVGLHNRRSVLAQGYLDPSVHSRYSHDEDGGGSGNYGDGGGGGGDYSAHGRYSQQAAGGGSGFGGLAAASAHTLPGYLAVSANPTFASMGGSSSGGAAGEPAGCSSSSSASRQGRDRDLSSARGGPHRSSPGCGGSAAAAPTSPAPHDVDRGPLGPSLPGQMGARLGASGSGTNCSDGAGQHSGSPVARPALAQRQLELQLAPPLWGAHGAAAGPDARPDGADSSSADDSLLGALAPPPPRPPACPVLPDHHAQPPGTAAGPDAASSSGHSRPSPFAACSGLSSLEEEGARVAREAREHTLLLPSGSAAPSARLRLLALAGPYPDGYANDDDSGDVPLFGPARPSLADLPHAHSLPPPAGGDLQPSLPLAHRPHPHALPHQHLGRSAVVPLPLPTPFGRLGSSRQLLAGHTALPGDAPPPQAVPSLLAAFANGGNHGGATVGISSGSRPASQSGGRRLSLQGGAGGPQAAAMARRSGQGSRAAPLSPRCGSHPRRRVCSALHRAALRFHRAMHATTARMLCALQRASMGACPRARAVGSLSCSGVVCVAVACVRARRPGGTPPAQAGLCRAWPSHPPTADPKPQTPSNSDLLATPPTHLSLPFLLAAVDAVLLLLLLL